MKTKSLAIAILAFVLALPINTTAQTDVNRGKYPDYSDCINPDYTMLQTATAQAIRSAAVSAFAGYGRGS